MPTHPLSEVFGFPADNSSSMADRYRNQRLCPFNNRVPNCTKDKANDPLGTCSVFSGPDAVITCPVRFRQDWIVADDAAAFFFPAGAKWTSLTEVKLLDRQNVSAGNIDIVLVSYDDHGHVLDFGAVEVQAVYISGNIRRPFEHYMENPHKRADMDWRGQLNYPRPDFLSSSRKRLAPQLIYKGGILNTWRKKVAVVLDRSFYERLPELDEVNSADADIAWLIYDLQLDVAQNKYNLVHLRTVYTKFETALLRITRAEPGPIEHFVEKLQDRLDDTLSGAAPIAPILTDDTETEP